MLMKIFVLALSLSLLFCFVGSGFAAHQEEKVAPKGTITKIVVTEYEITLKDDAGKESKVKAKDVADAKVGDKVIVTKDGKVKKAVKPVTGGY